MYLKNIVIKNIGPIDELVVELPFDKDGNPKPVVFVGENGTGKTILQSHIVDAFYEIAGGVYSNIRILEGAGYKYFKTSGGNLRNGAENGFSLLDFRTQSGTKIEYFDKINLVTKEDFTDLIPDFILSPSDKAKVTTVLNDDQKEVFKTEWESGAYFYQPANRYEEPFWKNDPFLTSEIFKDEKRFIGYVNKEIEITSSTKENKAFLMDLVLDFTNDVHTQSSKRLKEIQGKINRSETVFFTDTVVETSLDSIIWSNVNSILRSILKKNNKTRFGVGKRGTTRVAIVEDVGVGNIQTVTPSIDNLSLGEAVLLNLFINIIRHAPHKQLDEIQGIVVVDEVDVHLHTDLQNTVLPNLIKLFPKVQFVITTHSPLFVLGMQKVFGDENFELREMPAGQIITAERFSEFEKAYEVLQNTQKFENEIKEQIGKATKTILFVEGDYDTKYINKAGELLGKKEVLEKIEIRDVVGYGNLDNIWKNFNNRTKLSEIVPQKIILLYDCDTNKLDSDTGKVFKRVIPTVESNIITKGIENLFDKTVLEKAIENKKAYIDITPTITKTERGSDVVVPEKWEINKDEKGNLCDWICQNSTKDDFNNFEKIFEIIEHIIKPDLNIS